MSIIVGKRTFNQSFSNLGINDYPMESLYRSKMVLNEQNLANRGNFAQIRTESYIDNIKILKQNFSHVDEKEILTILEDCDNNLEIANEILQKSQQPKVSSPLLVPVRGRNIRKIQQDKQAPPKEQTISYQKEEKKQDTKIQEEDTSMLQKMQEVDNLATNVVTHLQSINSLDEAKNFLANVIYEVRAGVEKSDQAIIKKLQEEKQILVRAFNKQRQKSQASEAKNEELNTLLNSHTQEINKLTTINYTLGLRLKALDSKDGQNFNLDVY